MGSTEMDKPTKEPKEPKESKEPKPPTSQEQASSTSAGAVNPDWSGFQAYSPMPPHGYLASSPQAHPYMWGVQHIMPPYGTPPHPYVAMYPHGGIYAHPSMPPGSYPFSPYAMPSPNGVVEASGNTPGCMEVDGKASEGKEKLPIKRSKGSLGSLNMITGKNNEPGKTSGASANGVHSKSADSGTEGSSEEGSDADSQNNSQMKSGSRQDSLEGETSQNGNSAHGLQNGGPNSSLPVVTVPVTGAPVGLTGPATNLNIGMEYWGGGGAGAGAGAGAAPAPAVRGKITPSPVTGTLVTTGSRDNMQSQLWIQDERELKRQRRKQSNRESARRSRLRKQAECDELAQRAEALKEENATLRAELSCIRADYEQLRAQNASFKERLGEASGQEKQNTNGEGKNTGQTEQVQTGQ